MSPEPVLPPVPREEWLRVYGRFVNNGYLPIAANRNVRVLYGPCPNPTAQQLADEELVA